MFDLLRATPAELASSKKENYPRKASELFCQPTAGPNCRRESRRKTQLAILQSNKKDLFDECGTFRTVCVLTDKKSKWIWSTFQNRTQNKKLHWSLKINTHHSPLRALAAMIVDVIHWQRICLIYLADNVSVSPISLTRYILSRQRICSKDLRLYFIIYFQFLISFRSFRIFFEFLNSLFLTFQRKRELRFLQRELWSLQRELWFLQREPQRIDFSTFIHSYRARHDALMQDRWNRNNTPCRSTDFGGEMSCYVLVVFHPYKKCTMIP